MKLDAYCKWYIKIQKSVCLLKVNHIREGSTTTVCFYLRVQDHNREKIELCHQFVLRETVNVAAEGLLCVRRSVTSAIKALAVCFTQLFCISPLKR